MTVAAAGQTALETARPGLALPSRPSPTGLTPGEPVPVPAAPAVPGPPVDGAIGGAGGGRDGTDAGAPDPGQADRWATAATTAIGHAASASEQAPPTFAGSIRPSGGTGELPAHAVPAAGALPAAGAAPVATGQEAAVLDASIGPELRGTVAAALAPAGAASAAHTAEVTATKSQAERQVSEAQTGTATRQQAAAVAADQEVAQLHTGWGRQRATIVEEHGAAIRAESGQTRTEAVRTMATADAEARAKAEEAERTAPADGGGQPTGLWGRIKAAGGRVVSAVKGAASALVAAAGRILAAARDRVRGLLGRFAAAVRRRIDAAVRAIRDGAQRVWSGIKSAVQRAREFVTRLANAAADFARRVWDAAASALANAWRRLVDAARRAWQAAKAAVGKVVKALGTIRDILKILGNKLLAFIVEAVQDPQGKLVAPIVAKASPSAAGVPAKAEELARQQGGGERGAGGGGPVQRAAVRRQETEPAPPGEGFWSGVWRHLKAAGAHFAENWPLILAKVILGILLWVPMLVEELPKLWQELKSLVTGEGPGDRLDHLLGVARHVVNIVAGTLATIGVWALIIALAGGPVAEGVTVAAYETVSLYVIGADIALALAEMGKAWYSATRDGIDTNTRERYLGMFAGSAIGTAITIVMVVLGAIASRLAKAFKGWRAARGARGARTGGDVKPAGDRPGTRPAEQPSTKPGEPRPGEEPRRPGPDEEPPRPGPAEDIPEGVTPDDFHIEDGHQRPRQPGELDLDPAICFPAGTLVVTPHGRRAIDQVEVGSLVYAFDFAAGQVVTRPVVGLTRGSTTRWTDVHFDRETVRATPSHRFWVESTQTWSMAQELEAGMTVRRRDGADVTVTAVSHAPLGAPEATFNLSVDGAENYFVGTLEVLVHNITKQRMGYLSRPGYRNYVLRDANGKIYYSGMCRPDETRAGLERRHGGNHNRFDPAKGDKLEFLPGTREYGEARLLEHQTAVDNGTIIGRDGENYRGNRQDPLAEGKMPEYLEYRQVKTGCG